MGRHPKLVTRPDCDRLLWLCLLLHAKEHSPADGVVRGLDAAMMRGLWAIKAPLAKVQEALGYFIAAGMLFLTATAISSRTSSSASASAATPPKLTRRVKRLTSPKEGPSP
jgi:hypothetical protein